MLSSALSMLSSMLSMPAVPCKAHHACTQQAGQRGAATQYMALPLQQQLAALQRNALRQLPAPCNGAQPQSQPASQPALRTRGIEAGARHELDSNHISLRLRFPAQESQVVSDN